MGTERAEIRRLKKSRRYVELIALTGETIEDIEADGNNANE